MLGLTGKLQVLRGFAKKRQVGKLLAVTLIDTSQSSGGPTITRPMSLAQQIASQRGPTKAGFQKQRDRFLLMCHNK